MTSGGDVCRAQGCAECCHETEMVLTEEDAVRLAQLGHAREDFAWVDEEGYLRLRNVPPPAGETRDRCFFLKAGTCSVYGDRPVGCRWYPITVTEDGRPVRDVDCPHRQAFPMPPGAGRKLLRIVAVLHRKAAKRSG